MTRFLLLSGLLAVFAALPVRSATLTPLASFPDQQATGIAVSKTGRLFLCFPHWDDFHGLSVAELTSDGRLQPYPPDVNQDGTNLKADLALKTAFFCVQSVFCDDQDRLWILDTGAPGMKVVVPGQAKLLGVDLRTNRIFKTITFGPNITALTSYLNDVRIDTRRQVGYLTDSGRGGLVVVGLESGKSRRVLDGDPSTHAEAGFALAVNGRVLLTPDGKAPQFQSDGIELSPDRATLYYKALCGQTLYAVDTESLRDATMSDGQLAARVRRMGEVGATDGLGMDGAGRLYLSSIADNAVRRLETNTPETVAKPLETVAQDPRLLWPDSFAVGADGAVYVTCSQIQNMARFNQGKSVRTAPYQVFKLTP